VTRIALHVRSLLVIAGAVACHSAPAPVRSAPPAPVSPAPPVAAADPKPIVDGDVVDAHVRGIHVLVKRVAGAEEVATGLFIDGGARGWDARTAGIEKLALAVATNGGTKTLDKDRFTQKLSDLGSTIRSDSNDDYSEIVAWSLKPTWDETFTLVVETFRTPALPGAELELQRQQHLVGLKHELEDPDRRLSILARQGMFKGHPYANRSVGTIESVSGFTADQLADHLAKLRDTSRLLVVVVGDVEADHVIDSIGRALGDLPAGTTKLAPVPEVPVVAKGEVTIAPEKLPTNYIRAVFAGPRWNDPDFVVARVAMTWLHNREFEEVRTKRNLSYAPQAVYWWNVAAPLGWLYVTAVDPRATMKVMLDEAKKLRDDKMNEHDLVAMKASVVTEAYLDAEAPEGQAKLLASAQLRGGDWHFVRTFPDRVKAVTADQVQAWAQKAITHLHTFVIGDAQKIDKQALEQF